MPGIARKTQRIKRANARECALLLWRVWRLRRWAVYLSCALNLAAFSLMLLSVFFGSWNQRFGAHSDPVVWTSSAFVTLVLLAFATWQNRHLLRTGV